jgi:hypothetical protein
MKALRRHAGAGGEMTDWKRMEPQPEIGTFGNDRLFFTKIHDGDPVAVIFTMEDGDVDTDVVDGKRYRLTLVVEEEA